MILPSINVYREKEKNVLEGRRLLFFVIRMAMPKVRSVSGASYYSLRKGRKIDRRRPLPQAPRHRTLYHWGY
jgi:hypothetical protein